MRVIERHKVSRVQKLLSVLGLEFFVISARVLAVVRVVIS